MNLLDRAQILARGRRHQSAGCYDRAVADYLAALGLASDAPLELWKRRSLAAPHAIEPLMRALRELEISRIAIDEYRRAIGEPQSAYRGFSGIDEWVFDLLDRPHALALCHLRRGAPAHRDAHLEMMLDVLADDEAHRRHGPALLACPQLRPIHARVHVTLARGQLAELRYEDARRHLEQAILLAPCYGPAYRLLGEALVALGRGAAAARCFDHAAAFWNPEWWSIEFRQGMRMRVPGIVVRGHDIFYWQGAFLAVRASSRERRLRMSVLRVLRRLHGISVRIRFRFGRPRLWRLIDVATARIPLPPWLWRWVLHPVRRCSATMRGFLGHCQRIASSLLRWLFPARGPSRPTERRTWREVAALWLARAELLRGRRTMLRAASLHELLELLEEADA